MLPIPSVDDRRRVLLDANVILHAAFIEDSFARGSLSKLRARGNVLLIEEIVYIEACRILRRLSTELGLSFAPKYVFDAYLASAGGIFVGPGTLAPQTIVRKHDVHVVRAADEFDCWILTDDAELYASLDRAGYVARNSYETLMQLANEGEAMRLPGRVAPLRKDIAGWVLAEIVPGPWGSNPPAQKFTAFEYPGSVWVYFDGHARTWNAECNFSEGIFEIPFNFEGERRLRVMITFDYAVTPAKVAFGVNGNYGTTAYETQFARMASPQAPLFFRQILILEIVAHTVAEEIF